MFELFHSYRELTIGLCIVISSCILISGHDYALIYFYQHLLLIHSPFFSNY